MPGRGLRFGVPVALAVSKALTHSPPLATGPDKGQASTCSHSPEPGVGRSARNGSHYQVETAGRERSGAGRRGPHLAESRSGRGRAAARGMPPDGSRGSVRPGPPAAPPVRAAITGSRRAFSQARAPRPFCLRPRSRLRSAGGGGTRFPSRDGPELRELRAETVNEPRGAAPPTQRRPGSSGDPAVTAPSPDPTPQ